MGPRGQHRRELADLAGYLLFLIGGKDGSWASANLGVIVALLVGLFGALAFQRGDIAKQEADLPASETADAIEAK